MLATKSVTHDARFSWRILRFMVSVLLDSYVDAFAYKPSQNISPLSRWTLFLAGSIFLGIIMNINAPLHSLVLLPLFSIYLIQTSITSHEPLYASIQHITKSIHKKTCYTSTKIVTKLKKNSIANRRGIYHA